jgi:hypothetical protein
MSEINKYREEMIDYYFANPMELVKLLEMSVKYRTHQSSAREDFNARIAEHEQLKVMFAEYYDKVTEFVKREPVNDEGLGGEELSDEEYEYSRFLWSRIRTLKKAFPRLIVYPSPNQ